MRTRTRRTVSTLAAVGSETNAPRARAVLGGLLVSTLLTLLFIPTLYTIIEERCHREMRGEEA
jgi:multidrug efflux pump subunit AcrB